MLNQLLTGLLDLLAPLECAACGLPLLASEASEQTPSQALATPAGFCAGCGPLIEPAPPELRPPATNAAACLFQGPLADAIRRYKYEGRRDLQRTLAPLIVSAAAAYAGHIDAVVPVPLHPRKLRQRGCNLPSLLARPVARVLGVPTCPGWLVRCRDTAAQAGLSREARMQNVRGAFRAKPVDGVRILIVDDVRTTGATLLEAAGCLEAQGHRVSTLTLAWSLQEVSAAAAHGPRAAPARAV